MREQRVDVGTNQESEAAAQQEAVPGKQTLMQREFPQAFAPVQMKADGPVSTGGMSLQPPASGGAALPDGVRGKMESSFGADFSSVRVHQDGRAGALGAQAFAQGDNIHMAPGQYDPASRGGQSLLGHELSHVVQQREGRASGGEGQGKDAAVVTDSGLEAEADQEGERAADGLQARAPSGPTAAGAGAPIQGKGLGNVIQMRPGDATATAASHSFAVPAVPNIALVIDPVNRNQVINTTYHAIDTAMTGYMGDPLVSNWFTFGQHASREAGTQIRNLQNGLQVVRGILPVLRGLAFGNPLEAIGAARQAIHMIQQILDLLTAEGMIQQAMQLALQQAHIQPAELRQLVAEANTALEAGMLGMANPMFLARAVPFLGRASRMVVRLIGAIPGLITTLDLIYRNMVQGNREIYESVAPAAAQFLAAAQGSTDGRVAIPAFANDERGFLHAAFAEYVEVRTLGDEARAAPGTPESTAKLATRQAKAAHANLLIGFLEQLVILQPIFHTMEPEMAAMAGTMVLHDPNGPHPLAGDWQVFYTRMGIDPAHAPTDPALITPDNLPPLLPAAQRQGTIGSYFGDNIKDDNVHGAPPPIAPM